MEDDKVPFVKIIVEGGCATVEQIEGAVVVIIEDLDMGEREIHSPAHDVIKQSIGVECDYEGKPIVY